MDEESTLMQVLDKHTMLNKQILHPTSGMVVPGELMALVGPSGAGEIDPLVCFSGLLLANALYARCYKMR